MSLKSLIVELFLSKEVAAIKARLAEASAALAKIEAQVVGIAKEAAPEAQKLASDVLTTVLSAADDIRVKESGFLHDWEAAAYKVYNSWPISWAITPQRAGVSSVSSISIKPPLL